MFALFLFPSARMTAEQPSRAVRIEKPDAETHGVNTLRKRYPDQDLIRYADIDQVEDDAEKLRQMHTWLRVIADVLSHQRRAA